MVVAWIVEIQGDGSHVAHGLFRFVAMPGSCDRVSIPRRDNKFEVMGVVLIEHVPRQIGEGADSDAEPTATIYVQWIGGGDATRTLFN
jgi:hypothetical protein